MEIGPYRVREGGKLAYNEGSWDEFANVLFVDNPVGTGFSYVDTDSYLHELKEMSSQFIVFLERFFTLFPQYAHDDVSYSLFLLASLLTFGPRFTLLVNPMQALTSRTLPVRFLTETRCLKLLGLFKACLSATGGRRRQSNISHTFPLHINMVLFKEAQKRPKLLKPNRPYACSV